MSILHHLLEVRGTGQPQNRWVKSSRSDRQSHGISGHLVVYATRYGHPSCPFTANRVTILQVLSRRIPFCQYDSDPPVIIALHKKEIPQRPEPGHDDWDEIDDQIWALMERCWRYAPGDRPTSRDIQDHFGKLDIRDDRPETPTSPESDSTLLNPTEEVPNKVELEQVVMILREVSDFLCVRGTN